MQSKHVIRQWFCSLNKTEILKGAIRARLSDCEYFTVWHEPEFSISVTADQAISGRNADIADSLPIELPYLQGGRTVQVDAIVYDRRMSTVRAYEIKRANGDFDAGKKRSILKDLLLSLLHEKQITKCCLIDNFHKETLHSDFLSSQSSQSTEYLSR
jgi:hypothetical protein